MKPTTTIKAAAITLLFFISAGLMAQCKYQYKEKDVISGELNFVTEKFPLSASEKKEKVYSIKNLTARFEKKGAEGSLLINYGMMNSFGRMIAYRNQADSLIIRFETGEIRTIRMNKMASFNMTSVSYKVDLSYQLDEGMIKAFKSGAKAVALRITGITFDIDADELQTNISQKFNECWVD